MNERERLIELLYRAHHNASSVMSETGDEDEAITVEANYLLANGVTVREWIPVTERLPEEWKTVLVFKPSIDAIIPAKLRGGSWYATWDTTRLEYVSHWMPMPEKPQPPKGE